jgi:hypothetical protein
LDEAVFADGGPMTDQMMEWEYVADEGMMTDKATAPTPATQGSVEVLVEFKKIRVP